MTSQIITAKDADEIIEKWASQSRRVCFAACFGDLAWHVRWVGPMSGGESGRWIQGVDATTNVLFTDQYDEIILTEDEELVGIRFRHPKGFTTAGFEINIFIDKQGDIDRESESLLDRMTH